MITNDLNIFSSLLEVPVDQNVNDRVTDLEPGTLEWMKAQTKTIHILKEEFSDVSRVQDLANAIDKLSDSCNTNTHIVADKYWEDDPDRYMIEELSHFPYKQRWTYPFDDARTCRDIPGFFYNASDLVLEGQKYVAAQTPLGTTFVDFWKMMVYTKSTTIVTLNMPEEDKDEPLPRPIDEYKDKPLPRPVEYWRGDCLEKPLEFDDWRQFRDSDPRKGEVVVQFDDWTITYHGHSVVAEINDRVHAVVKREFIAQNSQTQEERPIVQFHYQNWPDFKETPSTDLFLQLLQIVEAHHTYPEVPLTVHCAAGMGRAGAFIVAHSLRRTLRENGPEALVNFPERVYNMRLCRKDMVSESSYRSIVDVASR